MTKDDKQIIDRGIKENWLIGDRTRLKRLLEKSLKLYRENVELENKIADLKANFDYVLEGKDLELKEKDRQLNNWYLEWQKQEKRITELEQESNKLLDVINNQDIKIADLEQKLEQTEKDLADYQFNYPKIKELEKTIKLLGERCNQLLKDKGNLIDELKACKFAMAMSEKVEKQLREQIEKMKCCYNCSKWDDGQCENIKDGYFFHCADFGCDKWEIKEND